MFTINVLRGKSLLGVTLFGVSAGFLLFGYDQGVANALTQNQDWLQRFASVSGDPVKLGAVLSAFVLGAFVGALLNFALGNRFARKTMLFYGYLGILIAGSIQSAAPDLGVFTAFRLLNGVAVGLVTSIVPTYVSELSKPSVRGRLVSLELCLAATGLMTAFWVTYGFRKDTSRVAWAIPLAIQVLIALFSFIALLFSPESPRWLCEKGRSAEAHAILERLYGDNYATEEVAQIEAAISIEREAAAQHKGIMACFSNNDQCFRYRTMLGIGANILQQMTGVNMATYYAGTILIEAAGLGPERGLLALGGLGIAGLVATIFGTFFLVDKLGRVRTMMLGAAVCMLGQILLAIGVSQLETTAGPIVAAVGIYCFLMSFSACWLSPGWSYAAEISPLAVRARTAGLGAAAQYIFNFMVVEVTPSGITNLGYKYYIIWAVFNAAMIPLLYFFFPEPANLELEDIDMLFEHGHVTVRHSPRAPVKARIVEEARGVETGEELEKKEEQRFDTV